MGVLVFLIFFFSKFKIHEPFPGRSRVAGSGATRPAGLGNFVTVRARGRAASQLQRPLPGRCHQPAPLLRTAAVAATRGTEQRGPAPSERQAPPPIALRLWRGAGAGRPRPMGRGQEAEPRPRPTCWRLTLLGTRPKLLPPSCHPDRLPQTGSRQSWPSPADSPFGGNSGSLALALKDCQAFGDHIARVPSPAPG